MVLIQSQLSHDFLGWLWSELPTPIHVWANLFQIFSVLLVAVFQPPLDFPATVRKPVVVVGDMNTSQRGDKKASVHKLAYLPYTHLSDALVVENSTDWRTTRSVRTHYRRE
jgi:hypothetical protein